MREDILIDINNRKMIHLNKMIENMKGFGYFLGCYAAKNCYICPECKLVNINNPICYIHGEMTPCKLLFLAAYNPILGVIALGVADEVLIPDKDIVKLIRELPTYKSIHLVSCLIPLLTPMEFEILSYTNTVKTSYRKIITSDLSVACNSVKLLEDGDVNIHIYQGTRVRKLWMKLYRQKLMYDEKNLLIAKVGKHNNFIRILGLNDAWKLNIGLAEKKNLFYSEGLVSPLVVKVSEFNQPIIANINYFKELGSKDESEYLSKLNPENKFYNSRIEAYYISLGLNLYNDILPSLVKE